MIGHDLADTRVLDACAGSGLMSLEAWSRGAVVVAVEADGRAYRQLRANVEHLSADITCHRGDVRTLAHELGSFDGVLLDPPYALEPNSFVAALNACTLDWLVLENPSDRRGPEVEGLAIDRRRSYGGTALTLYRRRS